MGWFSRSRAIFTLSLVAGLAVLVGGFIQVSAMLGSVGVDILNQALSVESSDKVNLALYLTLTATAIALALSAGASVLRDGNRLGGFLSLFSALPALTSLLLPAFLGYPTSMLGATLILAGLVLAGLLGYNALKTPVAVRKEREAYLTPVQVTVVAVFSALTAVLTGTTGLMLPSPTGDTRI